MQSSLTKGYAAIAALVALNIGSAMILSDRPAWQYFDLTISYMFLLSVGLPAIIWFSWVGVLVILRRFERPTRTMFRLARLHRAWLMRGTALAVASAFAAKAFSSLKHEIPHIVPFYADPALTRIDRWLFLGHDPWRLTHALMGPVSTLVIDRLYLVWFPVLLGLNAWICFTRDQRFQVRSGLTYILSWFLLGNVAAVLMSSVGPCFYEIYYGDTYFRPLLDTLRGYDALYNIKAFDAMNWLYENRDEDRFASGISAMPSLHIGIAFLVCLTVRHKLRARWPRWLAAAFVLVMWVGSVHLGWHYFVDGLFSIVGVAVLWWAAGRFVDWCERAPRPAAGPQLLPGTAA